MISRPALLASLALCGLLCGAGCPDDRLIKLREENQDLKAKIAEKNDLLLAQRAQLDGLNERLAIARGIKPEDMKYVFVPEKLRIDRLSGGEDYDGAPGDDGVTVYLQPVDQAGDVLKVAGDIRIELYDLANPEGQKLIAERFVPVTEAAEHWYGKLMTNHYTIRCPWSKGPPAHAEITIRARFVDYLSQRVITAQSVCTVRLAP
jgi:hypothetical protein